MGVWWHALAFVTHERAKMSHKPGRNVTQAGPKCHTRAKMSHSHVVIMAWRRPGDKPLSEPMMVNLLTHICVTRPQWVNTLSPRQNGCQICRHHFQMHFPQWKCGHFYQYFIEYCSVGSNWLKSALIKNNGLAPSRWHVIIWINDGPVYWCIYASVDLSQQSL